MEQVEKILSEWGFHSVAIEKRYPVSGDRIVCKVVTGSGDFILKGIPDSVDEKVIIGNTRAHEYLGNQKRLAPKLVFLPDGRYYIKVEGYYFYLMEFINGRQLTEKAEDLYALGQAAVRLHEPTDYGHPCSFDLEMNRKIFKEWFAERDFKQEYDAILESLPDFAKEPQCFIHTDIGPHNAMYDEKGKVVFVDLDDAGIGCKYIDLGWPFIMGFVDFNKKTQEMKYKYELAKAFLRGYYGEKSISWEELERIWNGAVYTHISYMQCYGPEAVDSLWRILKYGMAQKEILYQMISGTVPEINL